MRRDYLEQIIDRGSKRRPLTIQMAHNRYYRSKYNGKLFEPLREALIWKQAHAADAARATTAV